MHYNCLIVDDEAELAKMTAEYFNMFEIKTEFVDSAAAAYAFLTENEVDLILLDINLGDGSGFEVCKKLREDYLDTGEAGGAGGVTGAAPLCSPYGQWLP